MPRLTEHQSSVIETLFAAAPDAAVRRLEQALADEVEMGGPLAQVHALAAKEAVERKVRCAVLGPVIPLCRPSQFGDERFPSVVIPRLWAALRASAPELVAAAEAAGEAYEEQSRPPADVYDELCAVAARGLRQAQPAFAEAREALAGGGEASLALFIDYLDLSPMARPAIARLPDWLGRMSEERAATARLTYKDAVAISDEAGPRLIAMLLAQLPEAWLVLRILAAVVIRPSDRYLASSELARFGDYVLDDIERRLGAFRAFDPSEGRKAGVAAAEHLHIAAQEVTEFENTLELSRDGPWGARVAKAKQTLAELAEARLGQIEKAVDQALPLLLVRFGKGLKGLPRLSSDPDERLVRRAEGLMSFFDKSRISAATSGFGSIRAKIGEALELRLDQYVEDLLETMRTNESADLERIHAYLEIAAGLVGDIRGEKAAQIVRRRAAAA